MDRLAYSPSVKVWVKSDSGVVDLSPYVTKCSVTRNVDDISKAEVQFRNPKALGPSGKPRFLFTERETSSGLMPVFHPMDPITIVMQRLADRPIQVFTGYCDTTPYVQLFPGTARITASCTLKRLLYTYWDPGLKFVRDFMKEYGWDLNVATGEALNQKQATDAENPVDAPIKSVKLNDGSIGHLLYGVLNEIGGWNDKNIYIQELPPSIAPMVSKLFDQINKDNKQVNEEIADFIRTIIGQGDYGSMLPTSALPSGDPSGPNGPGNPNANAKAPAGYPLEILGEWSGGPAAHGANASSHGVSNVWQSVNAVDISVPKGTKTLALDDGTIHYVHGEYKDIWENAKTGGQKTFTNGVIAYLKTADNDWFYQHHTSVVVKDGQSVKKGDHIGYTGIANGLGHLHIACQNGNPEKLIKNIPKNPND